MRCFECNEVLNDLKIDNENYSMCPHGHYKLISYQNGSQLETMESATIRDGYCYDNIDGTTYYIKILNYTQVKRVRKIDTKSFNAVVTINSPSKSYVLFKTDYLIPAGSFIFDLPEFNGELFSKILDTLDNGPGRNCTDSWKSSGIFDAATDIKQFTVYTI